MTMRISAVSNCLSQHAIAKVIQTHFGKSPQFQRVVVDDQKYVIGAGHEHLSERAGPRHLLDVGGAATGPFAGLGIAATQILDDGRAVYGQGEANGTLAQSNIRSDLNIRGDLTNLFGDFTSDFGGSAAFIPLNQMSDMRNSTL